MSELPSINDKWGLFKTPRFNKFLERLGFSKHLKSNRNQAAAFWHSYVSIRSKEPGFDINSLDAEQAFLNQYFRSGIVPSRDYFTETEHPKVSFGVDEYGNLEPGIVPGAGRGPRTKLDRTLEDDISSMLSNYANRDLFPMGYFDPADFRDAIADKYTHFSYSPGSSHPSIRERMDQAAQRFVRRRSKWFYEHLDVAGMDQEWVQKTLGIGTKFKGKDYHELRMESQADLLDAEERLTQSGNAPRSKVSGDVETSANYKMTTKEQEKLQEDVVKALEEGKDFGEFYGKDAAALEKEVRNARSGMHLVEDSKRTVAKPYGPKLSAELIGRKIGEFELLGKTQDKQRFIRFGRWRDNSDWLLDIPSKRGSGYFLTPVEGMDLFSKMYGQRLKLVDFPGDKRFDEAGSLMGRTYAEDGKIISATGATKKKFGRATDLVDWNDLIVTHKEVAKGGIRKIIQDGKEYLLTPSGFEMERSLKALSGNPPYVEFVKNWRRIERTLKRAARESARPSAGILGKIEAITKQLYAVRSVRGAEGTAARASSIMEQLAAARKIIDEVVIPGQGAFKAPIEWEGRWWQKTNAFNYERIVELLKESKAGDLFRAGDRIIQAEDLKSFGEITVKPKKGKKLKPLQSFHDEFMRKSKAYLRSEGKRPQVRLSLVAEPKEYNGFLQQEVRAYFGSGELAGVLERGVAEKMTHEAGIFSGYVTDVWGEFYKYRTPDKRNTLLNLRLVTDRVDSRSLGVLTKTGMIGQAFHTDDFGPLKQRVPIQERLKTVFEGGEAGKRIAYFDEASSEIHRLMYPRKYHTERISLGAEPTPHSGMFGIGGKGKGLIAAAAITAGALLTWGAGRLMSNRPMNGRQVAEGQYGSVDMSAPSTGRMYTPSARISPNNTGYATNLNVETSDSSGGSDYRAMAHNLTGIARAHSRYDNFSNSLHIVDDGSRMDKESSRISMNRQLDI